MRKIISCLLAGAMLAAAGTGALAAGKVLKFAHDNKLDPFDNPAQACAAVFANLVKSDSNGAIEVELYPLNQLGSATEQVQMTRDGVIQATLSSTGALASYYPRIDVLNLPFAFTDNAATYEVFDGEFGMTLAADMEATLGDVVVLGFPDTGGFFAVTNSKKPIAELSDFEGIRIRTMTLPSHQTIMKALGAEAYPLAWGEVYSGLQTGVIDGQMNPVPIISFSNFSEVQKYLTLTNHLFSPYTFLLNKAFWDGLTADEQRILRYAAQSCVTASRGLSRVIEASDRGLAGLSQKIEVTALTPEQRAEMQAITQPAFEEHISKNLGDETATLLGKFKTAVENANSSIYLK